MFIALLFPLLVYSQSVTEEMANSGDTVLYNDTLYLKKNVVPTYNKGTFQIVLYKIGGAIDGYAVLEGSLVDSAYSVISTDSLLISNVDTQTVYWYEDPLKFLYYRVRISATAIDNSIKCNGFVNLKR